MKPDVKIHTKDNHIIYGKLTKAKPKSDKLIIVVHGMASHMDEMPYYNTTKFFPKRGFSVLRFNLYDWRPHARQLMDCTIRTHASDLAHVVSRMRKKGFRKIFLTGHSYGGPTILLSDLKNVDGIVLWDPTDDLKEIWTNKKYLANLIKYVKSLKSYYGLFGVNILVGKKMRDTDVALGDMTKRVTDVRIPIKFILAGKGILVKGGKRYYKNANKPKSIATIKNAGHSFNEEGAEERLFNETLKWFRRFS
ncbi:MAG: alpha/beta hydrolase [Candidatus Aenigmarchaeota archaeon]|nr:alpha/beta hydrolase [Candidatus Aenigmarchaeota archaeon]